MWDFFDTWLFGIDQEEAIEKFLKIFPKIDIRQIIEKVEVFNHIVKNRDFKKIEQPAFVFDEDLKKDFKRAVALSNFLGKYSFRSIFPLNKYIKVLQDGTVKVSMKYIRIKYKGRKYFSYYLVFKKIEHEWIIVKSNFLYNLQLREWTILIFWIGFFIFMVFNLK